MLEFLDVMYMVSGLTDVIEGILMFIWNIIKYIGYMFYGIFYFFWIILVFAWEFFGVMFTNLEKIDDPVVKGLFAAVLIGAAAVGVSFVGMFTSFIGGGISSLFKK